MSELKLAFQQATAMHNAGNIQGACQLYDRLLAHTPTDPFLQYAYGTAMSQSGMFGLAINLLSQSTAGQPANHEAWHNLGLSYRSLGMMDQAIGCYQRVMTMPLTDQQRGALLGNLSGCYINEGNPAKALELANQGLGYTDTPQLHNHKALALMELSRYEEGFKEYEGRFDLPEFVKRDFGNTPRWDGKPTKILAIHGEQGLGDELLFLTCLGKVLPLVEEVHVECAFRLLGLLRHSFKDNPKIKFYPSHNELIGRVKPTAWTAMGSLPKDVWPFEKYVYLNSSRKYRRGAWPRIGISWRGGTLKTHEYYRNTAIEHWRPLVWTARALGIEVISVQYGDAAAMAKDLDIPHDGPSIDDFDTLTGMIQSCDLLISVCNTSVHQAGAAGVPCWQLTPSKPDWRCGQSGDDCPWYDSVKFIRQQKDEPWKSVLERTADKLKDWAQDKVSQPIE